MHIINFKRFYFSKIIILLSIISLNILFSCNQKSTRKKISLNKSWEFYYEPNSKWYPAKVPGNIHLDLYNAGLIKNPLIENNADSLKWISEKKWIYRKDFKIAKLFYNRNLELVFDGLDTHCDIILNDSLIGHTNNMYRQWVFPIDDSIKKESNRLEVIFYSSDSINSELAKKDTYSIPDNRVFSRKSPYHFGWDWAPDLNTAGIYKDVYIYSWEKLIISDVYINQKQICDTIAILTANIEIESENFYNGNVKIYSSNNDFDTTKTKIEIAEGKQIYPIEFKIKSPELWWCNGTGKSRVYEINIEVNTKFRIETKKVKIGLRDIKLITDNDKYGQQFTFMLNGKPIFAKGANWVPAKYFNGNNSRKDYLELLKLAQEANFNMLRVWGGGIYENDDFYEICDSLGIMVWQDFMFSCAMYPLEDEQVENIRQEVDYQVKRLRNHPSIVLWCGNNEISNAWFDWGWQKQYNITPEDSLKIWQDYDLLFHRIIPTELAKLDKSRKYIPSSPYFGWGHKESVTHGDNHYWGVWWGMKDFEEYRNNTGRFMSEYGFQGFPDIKSLKKFINKDSLFLYSESLKSHQKHPFGFEAIDKYMKKEYPTANNFEDYVYLSQILQANGLQVAFDAHISSRPYCMGSLFWQFNDCWPSISWSAIDFYKEPKALYFTAKKAFENIHVALQNKNEEIIISATNHNNNQINGEIICEIKDFEGKTIHKDKIDKVIAPLKTTIIDFYNSPDSIFINNQNNSFVVLKIKNLDTNKILYQNSFVIGKPKDLDLPKPDFKYNVKKHKSKIEINIKPNNFVYKLYIASDNCNGKFSDNYFNLIPGEIKTIYFYPDNKKCKLKLKFNSLNSIYNTALQN